LCEGMSEKRHDRKALPSMLFARAATEGPAAMRI